MFELNTIAHVINWVKFKLIGRKVKPFDPNLQMFKERLQFIIDNYDKLQNCQNLEYANRPICYKAGLCINSGLFLLSSKQQFEITKHMSNGHNLFEVNYWVAGANEYHSNSCTGLYYDDKRLIAAKKLLAFANTL